VGGEEAMSLMVPKIIMCEVRELMAQDKGQAGLRFCQVDLPMAERYGLLGQHDVPIRQGNRPGVGPTVDYDQLRQAVAVFVCHRTHPFKYAVSARHLGVLCG
jgi:hypothetical protein